MPVKRVRARPVGVGVKVEWTKDASAQPKNGRVAGFGQYWYFQTCHAEVDYSGRVIGDCRIDLVESDASDKQQIAQKAILSALHDAEKFLGEVLLRQSEIKDEIKAFRQERRG